MLVHKGGGYRSLQTAPAHFVPRNPPTITMDWQAEIQAELEKAQQARARGNEGQARVCARRAAGIAAREYFALARRPTPNIQRL